MPVQQLITKYFSGNANSGMSAAAPAASTAPAGSISSQVPGRVMKRTKAWKPPVASARASAQRRSPAAAARPPALSGSDTDGTLKPPVASVHAMTVDLGVSSSGREASKPLPESCETAMCDGTNLEVLSGKGSALKAELTQKTLISERVIADSENESSDDDAKKASTDGIMISPISVAMTPVQKGRSSIITPSPAIASELGTAPRRSRRSAAVAAAAKVKRSYEPYEQSSDEAYEAPKKIRKESKAEADEITSYQALTPGKASAKGKRKVSATLISPGPNVEADGGEYLPASDDDVQDEELLSSIVDMVGFSGSAINNEPALCDSDYVDESDEEVAGFDPLNTLVDDDYIPFEGESDDEDESDDEVEPDDVALYGDIVGSDSELSQPSTKKRRVQTADLNAAQWVEEYNESHPVAAEDPDVQRFDANFACLIENMCKWAVDVESRGWYKLPREERAITFGFFALFRRVANNHADLVQLCLEGLPRHTRKVLGKADLCEKDLLDLPAVPPRCKHRLVYIDVATRLQQGQIQQVEKNIGTGLRLYKSAIRQCDLGEATEVKLYVGSSVNKLGGYQRICQHIDISNGYVKGVGLHYDVVRKPDTLCNFRALGVWQNPYADDSYEGQDTLRIIPPLVEALVITYLGLYTEANRGFSLKGFLFPMSSFALYERVREGLRLPQFCDVSLNRCWPLCQGSPGLSKTAMVCGNPHCRRPRKLSDDTLLGTIPAPKFIPSHSSDLTAPYLCKPCHGHFCNTGGEMRSREGNIFGRWRHETDFNAINKVWIEQNQRKCHNAKCGVPIHPDANLYGIENGIRCFRCHKFALLHRKEFLPLQLKSEVTGDCQLCSKHNVRIFFWEKIDVPNDPDQPSELCGGCYSIRCSFLQDDVPVDAQPKTIAGCSNAACWDRERLRNTRINGSRFVENINEHRWRCVRCDYCHEIGVERYARLLVGSLPKPPTGPILSHRFNSTNCIDCDRYISYSDWVKVDGGYRCASCVGRRCPHCNIDPAITPLRNDPDGEACCYLCQMTLSRGGIVRDAARTASNRRCCNPDCSNAGEDILWRTTADPNMYRCQRCDYYHKRYGTEWRLGDKCFNEACPKTADDTVLIISGDGNRRCRPCQGYFANKGVDKPFNTACHNFDHCGNDGTTYSGALVIDVKGDGNARCSPCHNGWVKCGRQFERGTPRPSLNTQQLQARVCSRPGCEANHQTNPKMRRWKEFVADGWVCAPCFAELKAMQGTGRRAVASTGGGSHVVDQHADAAAGDAGMAGSPVAPGNEPAPL